MNRFFVLCLLLAAATLWSSAYAEAQTLIRACTIGSGQAKGGVEIRRLGLRAYPSLLLSGKSASLTLYYEASVNHWIHEEEDIAGIALSPVFVCYLAPRSDGLRPYLEAGLGVASISGTRIANRDLSSNFHFENRIGFGISGNGYDFNVKYLHYSNSGLKEPNEGLDAFMVSFGHGFDF